MNRGNIFHRSFGNQCYALDENRIKISLTTGDDIEKVYICYGDPFDAGIMGGQEVWEGTKEEIKTYMTLDHNRIWNVVVEPKHKRLRYYFIVEDSKESLCFLEDIYIVKSIQKNCYFSGNNLCLLDYYLTAILYNRSSRNSILCLDGLHI